MNAHLPCVSVKLLGPGFELEWAAWESSAPRNTPPAGPDPWVLIHASSQLLLKPVRNERMHVCFGTRTV